MVILEIDEIESLPTIFKHLRAEKRMTRTKVAERAGISNSTVGAIERGKCIPTFDTIYRIAEALGIDELRIYTGISKKSDT